MFICCQIFLLRIFFVLFIQDNNNKKKIYSVFVCVCASYDWMIVKYIRTLCRQESQKGICQWFVFHSIFIFFLLLLLLHYLFCIQKTIITRFWLIMLPDIIYMKMNCFAATFTMHTIFTNNQHGNHKSFFVGYFSIFFSNFTLITKNKTKFKLI